MKKTNIFYIDSEGRTCLKTSSVHLINSFYIKLNKEHVCFFNAALDNHIDLRKVYDKDVWYYIDKVPSCNDRIADYSSLNKLLNEPDSLDCVFVENVPAFIASSVSLTCIKENVEGSHPEKLWNEAENFLRGFFEGCFK